MVGSGAWRNLVSAWPWPVQRKREQEKGQALSEHESHQLHLKHLLSRRVPTWSEQQLSCEECGRQLLAGERALIVRRGDELLLSCQLCEERLLGEGCSRDQNLCLLQGAEEFAVQSLPVNGSTGDSREGLAGSLN
jgi:hypothetical protein